MTDLNRSYFQLQTTELIIFIFFYYFSRWTLFGIVIEVGSCEDDAEKPGKCKMTIKMFDFF